MSRADLDNLLNSLLPFAQQMLKRYGEFYPFARVLTAEGEIAAVAAYTGDERATMILDTECRVVSDPDRDARLLWERIATGN